MTTKNLQDKPGLLVFKQRILDYLWLVLDISYDIKLLYFDRILGNIKCRFLMKNRLLTCKKMAISQLFRRQNLR